MADVNVGLRLTGDSSGAQKALDGAAKSTKKLAKESEGLAGQLKGLKSQLLTASAAIYGAYKMVD